ncbi:MAG: hypothetical protein IPJ34_07445 [Myxococcales bacterium]|nr:hypothetical protein [Myxococcales bacterium]
MIRAAVEAALNRGRAAAAFTADLVTSTRGRSVTKRATELVEHERRQRALASLPRGRGTRDELPALVQAIAEAGGFEAVVISDEAGLPVATSASATEPELLAGIWSLLLTIADRVASTGASPPLSILVQDREGRSILHRIFEAGGQRYLLTALGGRGPEVGPTTLDPALDQLAATLVRDGWSAQTHESR